MADPRVETVLDAVARHHTHPDALLAWAGEHLALFDAGVAEELEKITAQLGTPGTFLLNRRSSSPGLDLEEMVDTLFLPGDVRVQLLLFELMAFVYGQLRESRRQLLVTNSWSARLLQLGILDDARDRYQDALTIIRENAFGAADEADALRGLARVYQAADMPRDAISLLERVLAFDEANGGELAIARTTGNLAAAWSEAGDDERALELHRSAIDRLRAYEAQSAPSPGVAGALGIEFLNGGMALDRLGRTDGALSSLEQSLAAFHREADTGWEEYSSEAATALLAFARLAHRQGLTSRAQQAARDAVQMAGIAGLQDLQVTAMQLLSECSE